MSETLVAIETDKSIQVKTSDLSIRYIGFFILFITFGIFGIWAGIAPLDSAALAPGVVTVKSHRKTVQHLEGGIVRQLLIRDGRFVKAGETLLVLDDTQIRAQLEILRGQYFAALALNARLVAERDNLNKVDYPDELKNLNDHRIAEARQGQDRIFNARKNTRDGEIAVLGQRVEQLNSRVGGLTAQRTSDRRLVKSYTEEIDDLRELLSEGFADKQRLREMERSHEKIRGEIAELTAETASAKMQIGETQLQILQLTKEFQEDVVNQLGEVQATLFDIKERMDATEDKVRRTVIRAPDSGMILGLSVHTEGGVVAPGKPILDIVPQEADLVIDAQVSPIDIDRVQTGMMAEVRFSAFKQATTPKVDGKVANLSADRLINEQTGMPYYLAQVELTPESHKKLENLELLPGMPAEVLINTGERTLLEYLMQPVTNAFARSLIED